MRIICILLIIGYLGGNIAHAQTWQTLDSLGQILTKQQKFKVADSVLQLALNQVEALHGKDTSYAKVAFNLGLVAYYSGTYSRSEALWQETKQIRETYLGKKHLLYASSCNSLAILHRDQGLYDKAEPLYLEAKNIRSEALGQKHPDYATSCNNLAILYRAQGLYNKAEPLYKEAKNIRGEVLGKKHPDYATSCNNLAILHHAQGFYDKAEPLYLEAKSLREEALGKKHPDYANSCNNLANLYLSQGLYTKAEPLYWEAKNIQQEVLGKGHPDYTHACNNLAILYAYQGIYDKAEALYLEAKNIREEAFGKRHQNYASSCNNLASLYKKQGLYIKAEAFYKEAQKVWEQGTLGKKHPEYASLCNNLANLYKEQGFYDKAEPLYIEGKSIREETLGKGHPEYAFSCHNLASSYHYQGAYDKAQSLYLEAAQNKYAQIKDLFPLFSEQEKQVYWQSVSHFFSSIADLAQVYVAEKPTIMADLYNQSLFTKGIIFSSTQKMKSAILDSQDTVLINQYNNWKKQRETYTKLSQLSPEEQKKQNLDLQSMKTQMNDLEKSLSKKSALFGQNVQTKIYRWQEVKNKLLKNEVAIEIIKADSAYIALFLTTQTENHPAFFVFSNVNELEGQFLKYYKNCIEFKINDTVSYDVFWKPIADKLLVLNPKGFKKIYFSPDGVFHQLSLNTLKNSKTKEFVLEEANIQLISSSRDLIELNKRNKDLTGSYQSYQAYLLGYPIYGAENGNPIQQNRDRAAGFSSVQSAVGVAGSVSILPGTRKEVEEIFALFNKRKLKVNLLLAENATEEAVKNLKSPTILHVATHGFFIPEIKEAEVNDIQSAMNRNLLKNPFMRSGLLLAGCQKPNPDKEDGILTAEEVMNLTLDNTELVVMSACETGLGDIQAGEGVFGLQRAFQQAGAKSVLMSLWKVDDDATQTLMTEFYTALLKGQSKREAFKTAQMNLKKRFPEPYYWGAFVMVGE